MSIKRAEKILEDFQGVVSVSVQRPDFLKNISPPKMHNLETMGRNNVFKHLSTEKTPEPQKIVTVPSELSFNKGKF